MARNGGPAQDADGNRREKLSREIAEILRMPDVATRLTPFGYTPGGRHAGGPGGPHQEGEGILARDHGLGRLDQVEVSTGGAADQDRPA
jgi:hypothetical protein